MTDTSCQNRVRIIGAGLAGCEAAWQAANLGVPVTLVDMKPGNMTQAHTSTGYAELVCSNSLKATRLTSASGLLKEEMRRFGSLLLEAADQSAVPAGGALAVDREVFSDYITDKIRSHPGIQLVERKIDQVPMDGIRIIATGPLTQGGLFSSIENLLGSKPLHFFDAAAPVVLSESIDRTIVFAQSRYDKGGDDYLNCPMNQDEYLRFWENLTLAEVAQVEDFDKNAVFEGCMPVEVMAGRGVDTIRFGPMKPVGLTDPRDGRQPYAVVQLRQDDLQATMYNLVGFQTRLRFPEQKRVFSMIPGLESAEFLRYGVMHRNTYIDSPGVLRNTFESSAHSGLYFAGQITGVEGYMESASSGLIAGLNAARSFLGAEPIILPDTTMMGALASYVSTGAGSGRRDFQPMNANYGIIRSETADHLSGRARRRSKQERYGQIAERALAEIDLLTQDRKGNVK